jgi:hypothetical protein
MTDALAALASDRPRLPSRTVPLEPDQLERLRALGYLR